MERLSKAAVVDGGHHGLAGAGVGYEEVAVVALLAREGDQFEKALLERLQADLEGAQHHGGAGLGSYGAGAEFFPLIREEVAAVAVGLEHGADLADDVGVSCSRDADVPFEAAHLGGVGGCFVAQLLAGLLAMTPTLLAGRQLTEPM